MPDAAPVPADEATAVFGADEIEAVESLRPRPLGATVGVWRVRAADSSAVLKLLRVDASPNPNWAASSERTHPRWWRRELEALESGVLELLQPELRPPRLLHASDRLDGSLALWLEDLGAPASWTVEQIAEVARLLGAAQARLAQHALPSDLPCGFLRAYLEPRRVHLAEPFASRSDEILDTLDAEPQTLCHFDLHPANVFPSEARTAVIDWAYCGAGPIGSDAGILASDAVVDEMISPEEAHPLVDAVWDAYSEGLGDERLANAAARVYSVGTALRYSWLPAWLEGTYGPEMPESRRPFVDAAQAVFLERALEHL